MEDDFHTLSDEEIEEDVRMQDVVADDLDEKKHMEDAEGREQVTGEVEKRQGTRRKVLKPSLATGASNKMKLAQLVASKRTVAKAGIVMEITPNRWRKRVHKSQSTILQNTRKIHESSCFNGEVTWVFTGSCFFFTVSISSLSTFICFIFGFMLVYVWLLLSWSLKWSFYKFSLWNKIVLLDWWCWCNLIFQGVCLRLYGVIYFHCMLFCQWKALEHH